MAMTVGGVSFKVKLDSKGIWEEIRKIRKNLSGIKAAKIKIDYGGELAKVQEQLANIKMPTIKINDDGLDSELERIQGKLDGLKTPKIKVDDEGLESEVQKAKEKFAKVKIPKGNTDEAKTRIKDLGNTGERAASKISSGFTVAKGIISNMAANAITTAIGKLKDLGEAGEQYYSDMQGYTTAFQTMTGSAAQAQGIMQQLGAIAAKTPFGLSQLTKTTQMLMEYGMGAQDAIDKMQVLGDISQGDAEKLDSIAMAYGQISSAGKVQLQDIKQMINAGFNPLMTISEQTGESMSSLYGRISKGTLSVDELTAAMEKATQKGGKYYGAMAAQSKTLSGQISTLKDNMANLASTVMSPALRWVNNKLLPALINNVDILMRKMGVNTDITSKVKSVKGLSGAVGKIGTAAKKAENNTKAATKATKALGQAKRYLMGFDEINNINASPSSKTGSKTTAKTGAETAGKKAEASVRSAAGKSASVIDKAINRIKKKLATLMTPVKQGWDRYGGSVTKSARKALNGTKRLIDAVGQSIKKVWLNGTGYKTVSLVLRILASILNIIGAITNGIAEAWKKNETGTKIIQHIWDILNKILALILSISKLAEKIAKKINWDAVLGAVETGLGYIKDIISDIVDGIISMNKHLGNGDFKSAGKALSQGFANAFNDLAKWIESIDGKQIGRIITDIILAVIDFINGIDWGELLKGALNVGINIVGAVCETIANIDWGKILKNLFGIPNHIIDSINEMIEKLKIPGWLKKLLQVVNTGGLATLFTAKIGVTGFNVISGVIDKILAFKAAGGLSAVFGATSIGKLFGVAAAHPVIAAIIAVIAAIVLLYTKCKWFRDFVNGIFKFIKNIVLKVISFVKKNWPEILMWILNPAVGLINTLYKHCKPFRDFVNGIFDAIAKKASAAWKKLKSIASGIGKFVKGIFSGIWSGIKWFVGKIKGAINAIKKSAVGKAGAAILNVAGQAISAVTSAISVPAFANGGYVAANTPQLALVGDNRSQGEIITPEGKMAEIMSQVMNSNSDRDQYNTLMLFRMMAEKLDSIERAVREKDLSLDGEKITKKVNTINKRKAKREGR